MATGNMGLRVNYAGYKLAEPDYPG